MSSSTIHTLFADSVRTKRPADNSRIRGAVKALSSTSSGAFTPLCDCIDRTLLIWKGLPAVTSAVQETAVRVALIDPTRLALPLLSHLSSRLDCRDKAVRLRSCQILGRLLQGLRKGEQDADDAIVAEGAAAPVSIPDTLWVQLSSRLASRTKDRLPVVRVAACFATAQLQRNSSSSSSSSSSTCLSQSALRWSMNFDSSPDVRAIAVSLIAMNQEETTTLAEIIDRARDISASVRTAAYMRLRTSYPWASSSYTTRRSLIGPGLSDSSADVVKATWLLLASWLQQCSYDILAFLEGLDFVTPYSLAPDQDGNAEDIAASGSLPSLAAVVAERVAEASLWALFAFVESPQPKRSFSTNPSVPSTSSNAIIDPSDLWTGVKECFETYLPSAQALQPEAAFYWRMRAAWLSGARGAFSGGGGGGLLNASNGISLTSSSEERRAELLDALLPDAATLCDVARDVALGLGCYLDDSTADASNLAAAADAAIATSASGGGAWTSVSSTSSSSSGGGGNSAAMSAFRQLSLANGVLSPNKLAIMRQVPVHADPDALCTLRQLLILAQLVDYGDEMGRRKTIRLALQLLPQPALPTWAVHLVARTLACAFGCGRPCEAIGGTDAMNERFPPHSSSSSSSSSSDDSSISSSGGAGSGDAFCESISLQVSLIGSLRAAVDVCMYLSESESGEGGGGGGGEGVSESLRNRAEQLRQLLEEAEDKGSDNASIAALREEIEKVEDAVAEAVSAESSNPNQGLSTHQLSSLGFTVALDGVELRTHDASELAGLLWLRALTVTEALLRGSNIAPALQQRFIAVALNQVSTLALGPTAEGDDMSAGGPLLSLWQRLVQPSLVSAFLEVKGAGVRCLALLSLSSLSRAAGAQMANQASSLLYSIALDDTNNTIGEGGGGGEDDVDALLAAASSQTSLRVSALQALCDLGCAFGLQSAAYEGRTLGALLVSLIQPKILLKKNGVLPTAANTSPANGSYSLTLQICAAQGLSRLLLSGAYTLSSSIGAASATLGSCLVPGNNNSSSTSTSSSVSADPSISAIVTILADFYFALLWHEACLYASSRSVTTRAVSSSLASSLSSFSALSPLHQVVTLSSLIQSYRNMMDALGSSSLTLPPLDASSSTLSSSLSWAQSVFPAVASLSAKIQGSSNTTGGAKASSSGGGGKNDVDDGATEAGDGNIDDAGSVQSGVSAMLPSSGSGGASQLVVVAAAAWLSEALCLCIHTAGLTPLKGKEEEGGAKRGALLALPTWAASASPTDILCICLSLDAAADASAGKNTAPFARVLIQALKLLTPSGSSQAHDKENNLVSTTTDKKNETNDSSIGVGTATSLALSELSKASVLHLKSASISKSVQKLLAAWTSVNTSGGGKGNTSAAEATNTIKSLLSERNAAAIKAQPPVSAGGLKGKSGGGLGLQTSTVGPRLGAVGARAASRGKTYVED